MYEWFSVAMSYLIVGYIIHTVLIAVDRTDYKEMMEATPSNIVLFIAMWPFVLIIVAGSYVLYLITSKDVVVVANWPGNYLRKLLEREDKQ